MNRFPTISIVCLSYNRPQLLYQALKSIFLQTMLPTEVLVVDNFSSRSNEVVAIVNAFPNAKLLSHKENLGFTGGMNSGLLEVIGDYIILTEDDITLAPLTVEAIIKRLMVDGEKRIVGSLMFNRIAGNIRCAGGSYLLNSVFKLIIFGENTLDIGQYKNPFEVAYLPGAFMAAHRKHWLLLGGFRNRYFCYMEDVDLCIRAHRLGFTLEIVPDAKVWHEDLPAHVEIPSWLNDLKMKNIYRLYFLNADVINIAKFLFRSSLMVLLKKLFMFKLAFLFKHLQILFRILFELPELLKERRYTKNKLGKYNV